MERDRLYLGGLLGEDQADHRAILPHSSIFYF